MGWRIVTGLSGGGGFTLGPAQNIFTGADRSAAESARDAYATANPSWLATYNSDNELNIRLEFTESGNATAIYQVRNGAGNAWLDNNSSIGLKGDKGDMGDRGVPGVGAVEPFTQTAHGFTSSDSGRPVYVNSSGNWVFGRADSASTLAFHVIFDVPDANTIRVESVGFITISDWSNVLQSGDSTLSPGTYYKVSVDQAGKLIPDSTSLSAGQYDNIIILAVSATKASLIQLPAQEV